MEIKDIQAQILINRQILAGLYGQLTFYKAARKSNDKCGNLFGEYVCHNIVSKLKPQIAKLVVLQKALKADRADQLEYERCARYPIIFAEPDFWDDF